MRWTRRHVVVQARVYRTVDDARPAATAFHVWYRDASASVARHAVVEGFLEAVESLAVERALALLDLSDAASTQPPAARVLASPRCARDPAQRRPP